MAEKVFQSIVRPSSGFILQRSSSNWELSNMVYALNRVRNTDNSPRDDVESVEHVQLNDV